MIIQNHRNSQPVPLPHQGARRLSNPNVTERKHIRNSSVH